MHSQVGGAIYNAGGMIEMHACSVTANGAMMVCRCAAPTSFTLLLITRCSCIHSQTSTRVRLSQSGGAIFNCRQGTMIMHECIFTNNGANWYLGYTLYTKEVRMPNVLVQTLHAHVHVHAHGQVHVYMHMLLPPLQGERPILARL